LIHPGQIALPPGIERRELYAAQAYAHVVRWRLAQARQEKYQIKLIALFAKLDGARHKAACRLIELRERFKQLLSTGLDAQQHCRQRTLAGSIGSKERGRNSRDLRRALRDRAITRSNDNAGGACRHAYWDQKIDLAFRDKKERR
jgi:hypothetical protein